VFMGYDNPRHIADRASGSALAAPIFRDFMKVALADKPAIQFQPPVPIKLIPVNARTGMRARLGEAGVIVEAFKPGTAPPEDSSVAVTDPDGRPLTVSPEADRAVRTGTGGLY
jgi:penicillin-binding protein 1A